MIYQLATKGEAKHDLTALHGWWESSKKITGNGPGESDCPIMIAATNTFCQHTINRVIAHRHLTTNLLYGPDSICNDLFELVTSVRHATPNYLIIAGRQEGPGRRANDRCI